MEELMIGLDICDTYTQMYCYGNEKVWNFPAIICYNKPDGSWWLGENGRDAYSYALGDGVIVDKLLNLLQKEGTATIGGVKYEARFLMARYLELVLLKAMEAADAQKAEAARAAEDARQPAATQAAGARQKTADMRKAGDPQMAAEDARQTAGPSGEEAEKEPAEGTPAPTVYDGGRIGHLVITVPTINARLMDALMGSIAELNIGRGRVHIVSHTESFLYFVLSQKREIWNNQVGMFDLSEDFLGYYEMKVQRGCARSRWWRTGRSWMKASI